MSTPAPRFEPYRFNASRPLRRTGIKVVIGSSYLHIPHHYLRAIADGLHDAADRHEQETTNDR